ADADGKPDRGHALSGETRDEIVIAPAAAHRSHHHRLAFVVLRRKRQLRLEHGPGVVIEPTHDAGVDAHAFVAISARRADAHDLFQSRDAGQTVRASLHGARDRTRVARGRYEGEHALDLIRLQLRALREVAGLVLAPFAKKRAHARRA